MPEYTKKFVTITDKAESKGSAVYYTTDNGFKISLNGIIYSNLKSPINNKSVVLDETPNSAYDKFIYDMSILHDIIILENGDLDMPKDIEYLDDYLGQLGLIERYPRNRDIIELSFFINCDYDPYVDPNQG